jgi:hypothetical protein
LVVKGQLKFPTPKLEELLLLIPTQESRMIYARAIFALVLLVAVNAIVKFQLEKRENRDLIQRIVSRAARGIK